MLTPEQRAQTPPTRFAIFVVHNKLRQKKGALPIVWSNNPVTEVSQPEAGEQRVQRLEDAHAVTGQRQDPAGDVVEGVWYFAAETADNVWIE